ncbi:MAG: glycosyltransferase [Paludibacter sp.]|nr:glycosyltransferase [Paludibacter sp.]
MENIKVSIIIPVYNTEKYIEEAINSIINQTLREIEIIVVNDGSTDNSAKILENFAQQDNRIKILTHEKNKGQSVARNTGMDIMQGEYIYFFDSDDILELDCLELCYNKSQADDLDFLFFDAVTFYDNGFISDLKLNYQRTKKIIPKIYNGVELMKILLNRKIYSDSPCLSFIKTSFIKKNNIKFYPNIVYEDVLFTALLYVQAARVSFIDRNFFRRRIRQGSTMTTKISKERLENYFTIVYELVKFRNSLTDKNAKKVVNARLRNLLLFMAKKLMNFDVKTILSKGIKIVKLYLSTFFC